MAALAVGVYGDEVVGSMDRPLENPTSPLSVRPPEAVARNEAVSKTETEARVMMPEWPSLAHSCCSSARQQCGSHETDCLGREGKERWRTAQRVETGLLELVASEECTSWTWKRPLVSRWKELVHVSLTAGEALILGIKVGLLAHAVSAGDAPLFVSGTADDTVSEGCTHRVVSVRHVVSQREAQSSKGGSSSWRAKRARMLDLYLSPGEPKAIVCVTRSGERRSKMTRYGSILINAE